jgi:uncharacterized protein (DUF3084 family)
MPTAGFVLILAVLLLGGMIATIGDRMGMKIGKSRLTLFKLRPRQTATVVTVLTGILISATTLGTLFVASEQLRDGVFRLDRIKKDLRRLEAERNQARSDLDQAQTQKGQVQDELGRAKTEQATVQRQLTKSRKTLQSTQATLKNTQAKLADAQQTQIKTESELNKTQTELSQISTRYQDSKSKLSAVSQQATTLRTEITQLQAEQRDLIRQRNQVKTQIAQRDAQIKQLDQSIAQRDATLAKRETELLELDKKRKFLETGVEVLGQKLESLAQSYRMLNQGYDKLRSGKLALLRGQTLAGGVVRVQGSTKARETVDFLLQKANQEALRRVRPGGPANLPKTPPPSSEPIIQITTVEVEQLIQQIDDGQDYVVRILSAGNYLVGEKNLQVFVDVAPNRLVFRSGEQLAATSADPTRMNDQEILQRLDQLVAASQFRAQRSGVLADDIEIGIQDLTKFVERVKEQASPLDIKALAAGVTYTSGPLRLNLVAVRGEQVLFHSSGTVQ